MNRKPRIAIIGMNPYYESDRILYEALKAGYETQYISKRNIVETSYFGDGNEFNVFYTPPKVDEQIKDIANFPDIKPIVIKPTDVKTPLFEEKSLFGVKNSAIPNLFDIRFFDIFIFREISKTLEWATVLASYLLSQGKTVIDQKIGTEMYYKSKIGTFYKAISSNFPYAKTICAVSNSMVKKLLPYLKYPVIVKVMESSKGLGVYKMNSRDEILDFFENSEHTAKDCMIQECVDFRGDIRIFVVGNRVLGAMRREPQEGQWKGNVAQGAKASPYPLTEELEKMALDIVKLQNSEIIGVDVMLPKTGPVIIETNRAPQFAGFESSTGVNVARAIVDYAISKHEAQNN